MATVAFDLSKSFGQGGIPIYGRELVRHLLDLSERPDLIVGTRRKHYSATEQLVGGARRLSVRTGLLHPLALGPTAQRLILAYHRAKWLQWSTDFDFVHWFEPGIEFPRDVPYVVTVHDLFPLDQSIPSESQHRRSFARLLPRVVERAQRIIVPSEYVARELIAFDAAVGSRIRVVPMGVSASLRPVQGTTEIPEPYVVWIGRLDARKNLESMLQAWLQLPAELRETHRFVMIGPWTIEHVQERHPDLAKLLRQANITVVSKISTEEYAHLLTHARAMFFPSLAEGFGLPVIEAMKCGCPVLTASTSSLPEVAGEAAVFVDPRSVASISDGMRTILSDADLRNRLSQQGLEHVRQFSWHATAQKTVEVYRELSS